MSTSIPKTPVGVATVTGYGTSLTAFALALVAFLTGDRTEQTVGTIVAGGVGLVSLAVTQIGRYAQAHVLAKGASNATVPDIVFDALTALQADVDAALERQLTLLLDRLPTDDPDAVPVGSPGGLRLGDPDPALDDPGYEEQEPLLTDDDLAGRHEVAEAVGHGDADMRDENDGGPPPLRGVLAPAASPTTGATEPTA